MPFAAAVTSRRKRNSVSKFENERSSPPRVEDEQGYYHRRPAVTAVPKTKPGDYMHATFSVPKRGSSVPLFHRLLDLAHLVVHHAATQTLDCLLSVYIGNWLHDQHLNLSTCCKYNLFNT